MDTAKELEKMKDISEGKIEKDQEEKEHFVVDDDNKACWALKQIKKLQNEIGQKKELADSQIYQVKQWLEEETGKRKKNIEYLESLLQEYGYQLKKKDSKLKTHSLPFGDLKFRKQQPKWKYGDEKDIVESLEQHGFNEESGLIKVDKKAVKKEIKALVKTKNSPYKIKKRRIVNTETGQVIKGVTVADRPEKFEIKVR